MKRPFSKVKEGMCGCLAPNIQLKLLEVIENDAESQEIFMGLRSMLYGILPEMTKTPGNYRIEFLVLDLMWHMYPSEKTAILKRWRKQK